MITAPSLKSVDQLRQYLEYRLRGQPKAISSVCKAYEYIITLRDLERRKGPLGTFLFLGPSGVGKTEMARLMASYFSGSENAMIKIPCAGFSQPHMVHSIIGAPQGYIGFDKQPLLSQEYIDRKLNPENKIKEGGLATDLQLDKIDFDNHIEFQRGYIAELEEKINVNIGLISFLENYERFLNKPLSESDDKPLREILYDGDVDIRKALYSGISHGSQIVLDEDRKDPLRNILMTVDLYASTRRMIDLFRFETSRLEKSFSHLQKIEEIMGGLKKIDNLKAKTTKPKSVVILFDEIEKANQTLHNLLLEIMEEGKVTLANNEITDLSKAFIILTGNIGAKQIGDTMRNQKVIGFTGNLTGNQDSNLENTKGKDSAKLENKILTIAERELKKSFSPEFLGRIDDIIVFRPLSINDCFEILDYHIEQFSDRLLANDIELLVEDSARKFIIDQSLHRPEVGARLLNHKFKTLLKMPLGRVLLNNKDFKGRIRAYASDIDSKIIFDLIKPTS